MSLGPHAADQLQRLGVALVYLYGSEAIGRSSRFSDIDVGVVLEHPALLRDRAQRAHLRSTLTEILEPVLASDQDRELDLAFLQSASPVLQFEAINAGRLLFVADPVFQADYEASVVRDYLDIRPLVEAHYQAALDRVR